MNLRPKGSTLTDLNIHIVWCTKYRKEVITRSIGKDIITILKDIGQEYDIDIITGSIGGNYVYVHVKIYPTVEVQRIVSILKSLSTKNLLKKYPQLNINKSRRGLWAIGYMATTDKPTKKDILNYTIWKKESYDKQYYNYGHEQS